MATFNERLEVFAQKAIDEQITHHTDIVVAGVADHDAYKFHTGNIAGLRKAKELLSQALIDCQKT